MSVYLLKTKFHYPTVFSLPDFSRVQILPFTSLQPSSLNFKHEVNPCSFWHQYPIQSLKTWDGLLPFYRQTWSLSPSSLHSRTEISVMDVLPQGNLFKLSLSSWHVLHHPVLTFQGWDSECKPHNRKLNYYTSTDLINWKKNSSWKFSSRVLFLFSLAFTGIYLLKINFFNRIKLIKFSVVMLLACLFCFQKIERNKDENEAKMCLFHIL